MGELSLISLSLPSVHLAQNTGPVAEAHEQEKDTSFLGGRQKSRVWESNDVLRTLEREEFGQMTWCSASVNSTLSPESHVTRQRAQTMRSGLLRELLRPRSASGLRTWDLPSYHCKELH